MSEQIPAGYINAAASFRWPSFLPQPADVLFLEHIWVQVLESQADASKIGAKTKVYIDREIVLSIPGLDAVAITVAAESGGTVLPVEVQITPNLFVRLIDVPIALRLKTDLFRPARRVGDAQPGQPPRFEADPDKTAVDITLGRISLGVNGDGDITFDATAEIDLPPCMIGDSGVVIEARHISIHFDATNPPPGQSAGWRGVHIASASLYLPGELSGTVGTLSLTDCYIGNGGFTGTVSDTWTPALSASLFGMTFTLDSVSLSFRQNAFTSASIAGTVTLPFFNQPVGVEICPNMNGPFTVRLSSPNDLITLNKPGILTLSVESLGFAIESDRFTATISGSLRPLIGGLDWPTFRLRELAIDSSGNVRIDGGWLDLPEQYALSFHGFQLAITRLGFGKSDDGGNWIGFSGALRLVEGLSAGASVEGLRITWYDDGRPSRVSLNGVGVEFLIPNVLRFRGAISYRELPGNVHRFDGRIRLELLSLNFSVDATLVVGTAGTGPSAYTFFAIYLDAQLPAGIPLFSTGLALYGMAGLFAANMEPDRHVDEEWYGIGSTDGWYHRGTVGVTDLAAKWRNELGSFALGAGVTIGTVADNGYTFSGKVLLVIVIPGPIILIEGRASILKARSSLSEEPIFRALAVLDGRAGTFLIGLDAQYKYDSAGRLIEIHGGVEAFFSLHDADAWHLYLGLRDPREKRIRAQILHLFEANSYFMLDAHQLAMGAWVGYDKTWQFGPLRVKVQAWIEGNAVVSWQPVHLHGDLWLHGAAELSVFGFGLGLTVDARFAADVFDPFHVLAQFSVGISLPWPLPDFDVTITLEWGPQPVQPPIPLPLKEVAVEHFKVTESWPLERGALLLPNYDVDNDGFRNNAGPAGEPALAAMPIVPLDARPHMTFGRSIHDPAMIGVNATVVVPERERIGDPSKSPPEGPVELKYLLTEVALEKKTAAGWNAVARTATTANPPGVPKLYGSWAPVPAMPDGGGENVSQTKLWLWSKTPFDYTRNSGRSWSDWFGGRFTDYPCPPPLRDITICADFQNIPVGEVLSSIFSFAAHEDLRLEWQGGPRPVRAISPPIEGKTPGLCFRIGDEGRFAGVRILLPAPAKRVRIVVSSDTVRDRQACVDFANLPAGKGPNPLQTSGGRFFLFGSEPNLPQSESEIATVGPAPGRNALRVGVRTFIESPCPDATSAEITIINFNDRPVTASVVTSQGAPIDEVTFPANPGVPFTATLHGTAIPIVIIDSPGSGVVITRVCFTCPQKQADVVGIGVDAANQQFGPFTAAGNVLEVTGTDMISVAVVSQAGFCILQVCVTIGPTKEQMEERAQLIAHMQSELARWEQMGEVLEPHTTYRLKIGTTVEMQGDFTGTFTHVEHAYFRTDGPPGLAALTNPAGGAPSALIDLTRYVRQTLPPTVPPPGVKALLPKPVYRAYDVGVEFNEDYVDLMYRIAGRDLGIYLFDANNRPARDAEGRLLISTNRWGRTEIVTLDDSEINWIDTLNTSTCVSATSLDISKDVTLGAADPGQVLLADTLYEARLLPLLAHEAFASLAVGAAADGTGAILGRWVVRDEGTLGLPSHWEMRETGMPASRYVIQTRNISGGVTDPRSPNKPGTLLLRADDPALPAADPRQPGQWTDYRFSIYMRTEAGGAIGVAFRFAAPNTFYRFSIDRDGRYRRLVRVTTGTAAILAEDDFVLQPNTDYLVTVQAIGSTIEVYQDGALVFSVQDGAIPSGRIGFYCWSCNVARFADVRVDDFRQTAPVPYRFRFTTSQFSSFFSHLHSFGDETWRNTLPAGTGLTPESAAAVALGGVPAEAELRAFDSLAARVITDAGTPPEPRVRVTRIEDAGSPLAFLVDSHEPIDWLRTTLAVSRNPRELLPRSLPKIVKLAGVTFGANDANEESVEVVLRDSLDPTGVILERRQPFGLPSPQGGGATISTDDFVGDDLDLPLREPFGTSALDRYTIVDDGTSLTPSNWMATATMLWQTSEIFSGTVFGTEAPKLGTMAITGRADWTNVRIEARLRSNDDDAMGLVFRYRDHDHYYRFSFDSQRAYRRLVKNVGGTFTILWEDNVSYAVGTAIDAVVIAVGTRLIGYVGGLRLFDVQDADIDRGRVGFYSWGINDARFESLRVDRIGATITLAEPPLTDLAHLTIVTEPNAVDGPAVWTAAAGVLSQTSNVHVVDATPHRPGTYALFGEAGWSDVELSLRIASSTATGGAMGVMFRVASPDDYYRFSFESAGRRLILKSGGSVVTLWSDATAPNSGQTYAVTIRAVGSRITVIVDSAIVASVDDVTIGAGRIAFYAWANAGVAFRAVSVLDFSRRAGGWAIRDDSTFGAPSFWRVSHGALVQSSSIGGGPAPHDGTTALSPADVPRDFVAEVRMRSDTSAPIGIVFRRRDARNHYRLSLDRAANTRRLTKFVDGAATTLWTQSAGYVSGDSMTLIVSAAGTHLSAYLDGARLFDVTDDAHPDGGFGLWTSANDAARFESVAIRTAGAEQLALFRDRFAENDMSAWTIVDEGTVGAPSTWAIFNRGIRQTSNIGEFPADNPTLPKPGTMAMAGDPAWRDYVLEATLRSVDDDAIGLVFRYTDASNYYRFSMDRERGYRRLVKNVGGTFTKLWEDSRLYTTGQSYRVTIMADGPVLRGYLDDVPMFAVTDSSLLSGRIGLYTWFDEDARFSNVSVYPLPPASVAALLDDPLWIRVLGRWVVVDDGTIDAPSGWTFGPDGLAQTSIIHDDSSGPAFENLGTMTIGGAVAWTDYRFTVRVQGGATGAVGVVFRYTDQTHYYRLSFGGATGSRLVRRTPAGFTSLWHDPAAAPLSDAMHFITVDVSGTRIRAFINGFPLFAIDDAALPNGRIGLYAWNAPAARFRDVQVWPFVWVPHYAFGEARTLPSGTRLRLFSGGPQDAPAAEPNVLHRFAARTGERGRCHFLGDTAELRVRNANGVIEHGRGFARDGFATVAARVLRKRDGTAFFLFPPSGEAALTQGEYRLRLTFLRDDRAAHPTSPVYSQAGSRLAEEVVLDVPWKINGT